MMELLTEVNDQILERVNTSLDEAEGLRKKENETNLLIVQTTPKHISGISICLFNLFEHFIRIFFLRFMEQTKSRRKSKFINEIDDR